MFGWKRKVSKKLPEGAAQSPVLGWDLHSHLLAGVDDGAKTIADSLDSVRALHGLGYRASVVTPHIYKGVYPNTLSTLEPALAELRAGIAAAGIDYEIHMAAEYFADEHLIELATRDEPLLTFGGDQKLVLFEFPYSTEPLLWADAIATLHRRGYQPVLAHIERYRFVTSDPDVWLGRFAQIGVKLQCNIGSLVGQYGPEAERLARRILDEDLATFWGTDLHRARQIEAYITPGLTHLTSLDGELNAALHLRLDAPPG
jgi:tyrosine-protein phosphatase YwqE